MRGFSRTLDCAQVSGGAVAGGAASGVENEQVTRAARRGFLNRILQYIGLRKLPRASPSQANPSILLGERVDNEDDVLHIRQLPDFDGTLGAKDCELMMQYLTAPYCRIPMLLKFFSNEIRLRALRNHEIQEVLDAALFEPGQWQEELYKEAPLEVPAANRDNLCTPCGLLFNELLMSPSIIMTSVYAMLERVIEMDTGKFSALSESILYVVRLAIRLESYIFFIVRNRKFHKDSETRPTQYNGAYYEANLRGLEHVTEETLIEAQECQQKLRKLLDEKIFKIIARWINKCKEDGKMSTACMLHAHLAYLFRNVQAEDLNPSIVFSVLASQIFLFNNYKYDLDLEPLKNEKKARKDDEEIKDDLKIPQVELFDLFQVNRNKIMSWLLGDADNRNAVCICSLHMLLVRFLCSICLFISCCTIYCRSWMPSCS